MRILILANHDAGLYKFRKELLEQLIDQKYQVYIVIPRGDFFSAIQEIGCKVFPIEMDRRGKNPLQDVRLFWKYKKQIKEICPDVVLTYTVKPNIYGGIASALCHVPCIANITGLGTAVENSGILRRMVLNLYRIALRKSACVFFQNTENQAFFHKYHIVSGKSRLIPGSGVNLRQYAFLDYPQKETVEFVFVSRVMKDKGIEEYLHAAEYLTKKYSNIRFHVCGFCEEKYQGRLEALEKTNVICYHGMVQDIRKVFGKVHCLVHPSYHEGMSNAVLEASACGRPCLCSDIAGCREIIEDEKTGFLFPPKDAGALISTIERFLQLSLEEQREMGKNARQKVKNEFDRNIVVKAYMDEINQCMTEGKL